MILKEPTWNNSKENRTKIFDRIKKTCNMCLKILNWTLIDEEIWVDMRSQADRHSEKTWEMYELEMENAEKDTKYFIDKSNENDWIKN